jgi:nitrogen fixation protein NifB
VHRDDIFAAVACHYGTLSVSCCNRGNPEIEGEETTMNSTPHEQNCIGPDPHPGMIQLPVAPRINHRIRFDPLNEKKQTHVLPQTAVRMVADLQAKGSLVDTVLIYGPGDPLADIELPLETIVLLQKNFPELKIIIRTLGIGGLQHADKLQQAGVSEVEILVDGADPTVLEKLYAWIRPGFKTLKISEAAEILCSEQAQAIQAFKDAGLLVRIVTTLYPTANDDHLELLARKVDALGADEMILHPYICSAEADITLPDPDPVQVGTLIGTIANILPITQGRPAASCSTAPDDAESTLPKPRKEQPNIAVVSSNGMDVDLHLGQAPQLLVYGPRDDGLNCLLECRPAPSSGTGNDRWDILAGTIPDCFALLAASAGERPRQVLDSHGIQVIITQENIEGTVDLLYGGGKKGRCKRPATT